MSTDIPNAADSAVAKSVALKKSNTFHVKEGSRYPFAPDEDITQTRIHQFAGLELNLNRGSTTEVENSNVKARRAR